MRRILNFFLDIWSYRIKSVSVLIQFLASHRKNHYYTIRVHPSISQIKNVVYQYLQYRVSKNQLKCWYGTVPFSVFISSVRCVDLISIFIEIPIYTTSQALHNVRSQLRVWVISKLKYLNIYILCKKTSVRLHTDKCGCIYNPNEIINVMNQSTSHTRKRLSVQKKKTAENRIDIAWVVTRKRKLEMKKIKFLIHTHTPDTK